MKYRCRRVIYSWTSLPKRQIPRSEVFETLPVCWTYFSKNKNFIFRESTCIILYSSMQDYLFYSFFDFNCNICCSRYSSIGQKLCHMDESEVEKFTSMNIHTNLGDLQQMINQQKTHLASPGKNGFERGSSFLLILKRTK